MIKTAFQNFEVESVERFVVWKHIPGLEGEYGGCWQQVGTFESQWQANEFVKFAALRAESNDEGVA